MGASLRILLVDDQQPVLFTYALILEHQGYRVRTASTCDSARERLREDEYDVLICDFSMGEECSGFDVVAFARERHPHISALLLTGFYTSEVIEEAEKRQITVLLKPLEIEELLGKLQSIAQERGAA